MKDLINLFRAPIQDTPLGSLPETLLFQLTDLAQCLDLQISQRSPPSPVGAPASHLSIHLAVSQSVQVSNATVRQNYKA
jgi:hypothetical protein